MSDSIPKITVVMVVGHQRKRAERALQSILIQTDDLDCEILVVITSNGDLTPLPEENRNQVRTLRFRRGQHIGDLRRSAVQEAQGEIVVFLEDHVTIESGYLQAIVGAFKDGWAAIGPVVRNANPNLGVSNVVHLLHYGLWDPSTPSGEVDLLPGNNSAYRKTVLDSYDDRLGHLLLTDTVLQLRMRADGHGLYSEEEAQLNHLNATNRRNAMTSEYLIQRCFVAARKHEFGWSGFERAVALIRTPLTPWVRLFRLIRFMSGRLSRRQIYAYLPTLVILQHAAAWGQLVGLLVGHGEAPQQFTEYELDYPRPSNQHV